MEQDIKDAYLYQLALLKTDPHIMSSYGRYYKAAVQARSALIRELRFKGVSGVLRAEMNTVLDKHVPDYKDYLWAKDPTCQLCYVRIETRKDATLDHIFPKSKGGTSEIENLQLAHGRCNVMKSDKIDFTLWKNQFPLAFNYKK